MSPNNEEIDVTAILKEELRNKHSKILQVRENIERDYNSILEQQFFVTTDTLTLLEGEIAKLNRKIKLLKTEWKDSFDEEF